MPLHPELGFLAGREVEVYTATWCPDCRRLERWLAENEVAHRKVDIDTADGAAEELEEATGKRGVPYLKLDRSRWVRGYHKELPGRFDPRLLVRELREAVERA
jgi:glutaredoxin